MHPLDTLCSDPAGYETSVYTIQKLECSQVHNRHQTTLQLWYQTASLQAPRAHIQVMLD